MIGEIIAILLVGLSGLAVAVHYRNQSKKYKNLYEGVKKYQPNPRPHMSPKAIQSRIDLQHYLEIRSQVLLRDNFRCQECNFYKHLEVHHIIPRSKGGSDEPSNLITLCQRCHAKKHGFAHRENKRKRHTKRNKRKKFKKYIMKHHKELIVQTFPVETMEDVHPHQEDLSPESDARRKRLYEKWKNNELNQTNKKQDVHE